MTSPKQKKVYIVDARSKNAAQGNRMKGGGFEQEEYYTDCQVEFGNIANIHDVRDSYKKIALLCRSYQQIKGQK